jgi:UDP-N-acetylglucosamine diphosphorylase/glucosamine-1-phosphate N-acetyltransferase
MVNRLWDLVSGNGEQIAHDFRQLADLAHAGYRPEGMQVVGPSDRLLLDPSAQLDPLVVADTRGGPVVVARDAVVTAFSRLEGPCFVGPGTQVFGARVRAGTTLGPHCRIGGEVEASIVHGFSNKYHDGFLGHSYLGEWVNLGAGTQTSDLRLDYAPVRVRLHGDSVPTGSTKVGSFLGDHVKSGLGTLLNSGTVAGPFAQLLPNGRLLPRDVPAFGRCGPHGLAELTDLEELFGVAATVMKRRGLTFTSAHRALYQSVHAQTAGWRRQAAAMAETRLRRSA